MALLRRKEGKQKEKEKQKKVYESAIVPLWAIPLLCRDARLVE
jgi:hypothetical protein